MDARAARRDLRSLGESAGGVARPRWSPGLGRPTSLQESGDRYGMDAARAARAWRRMDRSARPREWQIRLACAGGGQALHVDDDPWRHDLHPGGQEAARDSGPGWIGADPRDA